MKHEYTAILNHLRVKHNMTLTQYTQTYIKGEIAVAGPGDHEPVEITPELNIAEEEEEEAVEVDMGDITEEMGDIGDITEEMGDMGDITEEMEEEVTSEVENHQEEFYIVDPSNIN